MFKVDTAYFESLKRVRAYREVLLSIQARLRDTLGMGHFPLDERQALREDGCVPSKKTPRIEDAVREVLIDEPRQHGFAAEEMRLRISVCVPAKFWVGVNLKTPQFSVPSGLEHALKAWRRLTSARDSVYRGKANRHTFTTKNTPEELQSAWLRIRRVYLDVSAKAGHARGRVAARLHELEEKRRKLHSQALSSRTEKCSLTTTSLEGNDGSQIAAEHQVVHLVSKWRHQRGDTRRVTRQQIFDARFPTELPLPSDHGVT